MQSVGQCVVYYLLWAVFQ